MSAKTTQISFWLPLLALQGVYAQTSLYIPGFDPQPVTANVLGVGADGLTTWLIAPGVTSGSFDDYGFYGPATLVEGASQANVIYDDPTFQVSLTEDCELHGSLAVCTVAGAMGADSSPLATIVTEIIDSFEIQGGSTISGDATPTPGPTFVNGPAGLPVTTSPGTAVPTGVPTAAPGTTLNSPVPYTLTGVTFPPSSPSGGPASSSDTSLDTLAPASATGGSASPSNTTNSSTGGGASPASDGSLGLRASTGSILSISIVLSYLFF